jgi:hypothetical protein
MKSHPLPPPRRKVALGVYASQDIKTRYKKFLKDETNKPISPRVRQEQIMERAVFVGIV